MMINLLNVVHTSQNFNLAIYFTLKMRKLAFFFFFFEKAMRKLAEKKVF